VDNVRKCDSFIIISIDLTEDARGSLLVEALRYQSEGPGLEVQ
jgi:hypothetical protein